MQADIKISPVNTINQLKTRLRKLDLKKNWIIAKKKEGCTKDYVLVLEADNWQGSCKLSLHDKLAICENHTNPKLYPGFCSQKNHLLKQIGISSFACFVFLLLIYTHV